MQILVMVKVTRIICHRRLNKLWGLTGSPDESQNGRNAYKKEDTGQKANDY